MPRIIFERLSRIYNDKCALEKTAYNIVLCAILNQESVQKL